MSTRRLARLNEQLKREISSILRRDVRDPRVGSPTVTGVAVTADLWLARVYVRPDPTIEDGSDALLEGLTAAAPFIRRALGKTLRVRRVPELRFEADRTLEQALRVERILHEVLPSDSTESAAELEEDGEETGDREGADEAPKKPTQ